MSQPFVAARCPICGSAERLALGGPAAAPVHCNTLYPTAAAALAAPRAPIELAYCRRCGHLYNGRFTPSHAAYTQAYENSLHFSPRFRQYIAKQAQQLIARHRLHGKYIVDVGCGKGEFLTLLCDMAGARGAGYDPSFVADRRVAADDVRYDGAAAPLATGTHPVSGAPLVGDGRITFVQDYFDERYAAEPADLLCCRQVLEHIPEPHGLLRTIRSALMPADGVAYLEVPNADYMLREMAIWDIVYEHVGYFGAASLAALFERGGFAVESIEETYEGQYLTITARPADRFERREPEPPDERLALAFADGLRRKIAAWRDRLGRLTASGRSVAAWGAGTKGTMFLNVADERRAVTRIVDLNPRKHGMHVAGTGQPIVAPGALRTAPPDVVLVMNRIYLDEIRRHLGDLGVNAECVTV